MWCRPPRTSGVRARGPGRGSRRTRAGCRCPCRRRSGWTPCSHGSEDLGQRELQQPLVEPDRPLDVRAEQRGVVDAPRGRSRPARRDVLGLQPGTFGGDRVQVDIAHERPPVWRAGGRSLAFPPPGRPKQAAESQPPPFGIIARRARAGGCPAGTDPLSRPMAPSASAPRRSRTRTGSVGLTGIVLADTDATATASDTRRHGMRPVCGQRVTFTMHNGHWAPVAQSDRAAAF